MKTFGEFFDLVAARPEARGGHRHTITHDWLRRMTAEEWQKLRDSQLTLEAFNAFARRQREYLTMSAAFIPSDSAFEELHASTMKFISAIMEVGRQCGLELDTDWTIASVPNPLELEKMGANMREARKPYSCSVYRIAKAVDSSLPDVFMNIWQTPERPVKISDWPSGSECIGVVGGDTREEAQGKLFDMLRNRKVIPFPWPTFLAK